MKLTVPNITVLLLAVASVLFGSVFQNTADATSTDQSSLARTKTWTAIKTSWGVMAKLKTVMLHPGVVSYRIDVVADAYQYLTIKLLNKDGFELASSLFHCTGTQTYTGEMNCSSSDYRQMAGWDLANN